MSWQPPRVTPAQVVAEARRWLGAPWQHQGRDRAMGVDCAGLVICVARALALVPPDFDVVGYSRVPDGSMQRLCADLMQPIEALELGCVALLAIDPQARGAQAAQHVALVGDYRGSGYSLIHAASLQGRVVEHRLVWTRTLRPLGLYRMPGVTH